jgi:hypothetical protein
LNPANEQLLSKVGKKSDDVPGISGLLAIKLNRNLLGMHTIYLTYEEKLLDMMIAYSNLESSLRFSLTHGGRYLPFDEGERQAMLERRAFALARLAINKVMGMQTRINTL